MLTVQQTIFFLIGRVFKTLKISVEKDPQVNKCQPFIFTDLCFRITVITV